MAQSFEALRERFVQLCHLVLELRQALAESVGKYVKKHLGDSPNNFRKKNAYGK